MKQNLFTTMLLSLLLMSCMPSVQINMLDDENNSSEVVTTLTCVSNGNEEVDKFKLNSCEIENISKKSCVFPIKEIKTCHLTGGTITYIIHEDCNIFMCNGVIISSEEIFIDERTKSDFIIAPGTGNSLGMFFREDNVDTLLENSFKAIAETGATYTKFNVAMFGVTRGGWGNIDKISTLAQKHDLSIIPFFSQSSWGENTSTQDISDFIVEFIQRYKESMSIEYIELLNEIATPAHVPSNWSDSVTSAVEYGDAVYDRVKNDFPDIQVGSVSFSQIHAIGNTNMPGEEEQRAEFYANYFSLKPKMDFLALHDYPHYGTTQDSSYNYASQFKFIENYRSLLDSYGYSHTPIMVTEGGMSGDVSSAEFGYTFAQGVIVLSSKKDLNLIGIIKGVMGKGNGTDGDKNNGMSFVVAETGEKYSGYTTFTTAKTKLDRYSIFKERVSGTVGGSESWVMKFSDVNDNNLYIAFSPRLISYTDEDEPDWIRGQSQDYIVQDIVISVGKNNTPFNLTSSEGISTCVSSSNSGTLTLLSIGLAPVYVEEGCN